MEVSSVSLCCGRNATGASILVDVNRHVDQTGSVILSKCLINAGDSSQRFCGDNRMKLSRIKCIILTSLAPHNVSGLPGMILCLSSLGVGHLKIFGPPGTQGLIDSMSTFINRRYPELIVVECGLMGDSSIHSFDVDNFIVAVRPVWVAKSCTSPAIAVAATVFPFSAAATGNGIAAHFKNTAPMTISNPMSVLPYEVTFATSPSLQQLTAWAAEKCHCVLAYFIPLTAACAAIVSDPEVPQSKRIAREIASICKSKSINGVFFNMELDQNTCELRQAQETLLILNKLCRPHFPTPLAGLTAAFAEVHTNTQEATAGDRRADERGHYCIDASISTPAAVAAAYHLQSTNDTNPAAVNSATKSLRSKDSTVAANVPIELSDTSTAREGDMDSGGSGQPNNGDDAEMRRSGVSETYDDDATTNCEMNTTGELTTDDAWEICTLRPGDVMTAYPLMRVALPQWTAVTRTDADADGEPADAAGTTGGRDDGREYPHAELNLQEIVNTAMESSVASDVGDDEDDEDDDDDDEDDEDDDDDKSTSDSCGGGDSSEEEEEDDEEASESSSSEDSNDDCPGKADSNRGAEACSSAVDTENTAANATASTLTPVIDSEVSAMPATPGATNTNKSFLHTTLAVHRRSNPLEHLARRCSARLDMITCSAALQAPADAPAAATVANADGQLQYQRSPLEGNLALADGVASTSLPPALDSVVIRSAAPTKATSDPTPFLSVGGDTTLTTNVTMTAAQPCNNAEAAAQLRAALASRKRKLPAPDTDDTANVLPTNTSTSVSATSSAHNLPKERVDTVTEDGNKTQELNTSAAAAAAVSQDPSVSASISALPPQSSKKCTNIDEFVIPVNPPNPNDITVTFLGTGSATPSKHRNNSCIMVSVPPSQTHNRPMRRTVLLDVGEGVATQMYQAVGGDSHRFDEMLLSICIVWISHHHADHICGLPLLLEHIQRAKLSQKRRRTSETTTATDSDRGDRKLLVIAPPEVLKYYEYAACIAGLDDLVTFLPTAATLFAGCTGPVREASGGVVTKITSVAVQHCRNAFAAVIEFGSGFNTRSFGSTELLSHGNGQQRYRGSRLLKVVYSGDCRPSDNLVAAGADCDLLIHEATFGDDMCEDAVNKRHCTISEAVYVGRRMRATHTVLTHFSQRYPAAVNQSADYKSQTYAVAFDFLRFAFPSQMKDLPSVTGRLTSILAALEEEKERERKRTLMDWRLMETR